MIQRIQTVYLLFAFCLMAVLVFIPFSATASSFMISFYTGYFAIAAFLALVTVFLFKKRRKQIKMAYALLLVQVFAYLFFFIFDRQNRSFTELFQQVSYTFIFPFVAFIFIYLAVRGIRKDEKLVRSLDRLR